MKNRVWLHFVFGMLIALILVAMVVACGSLTIKDLDWKSLPPVEKQEAFFGGLAAGLISGAIGLGTSLGNYFSSKNTQETIWEREDNAVARRAADLENAGLSKTLAAGSAATTNVTSSPQVSGNGMLDALAAAGQVAAIKNQREENANLRKSREVMNADIAEKYGHLLMTNAQRDYYNASAQNLQIDNQLKSYSMLEIMERIADLQAKRPTYGSAAARDYANALLTDLQYQVFKNTGVSPNMNGAYGDLLRRAGDKSGKPVFDYEPTFGERFFK